MGEAGAHFSRDVARMAEQVVDLLARPGDVSWHKMLGGVGVFAGGAMFALIDSDARLHLRVGNSNRARFEVGGSAKHGRMPYCRVPDAVIEGNGALLEWARASVAVNAG